MKKSSYVYLATLFLGFHYFLIIYINSSFLSNFVSTSSLSLLYTIGALINITLLACIPLASRYLKTRTLTALILALEFFIVFGISRYTNPIALQILFVLQQAVGSLITYCLDLFLESTLPNEKKTGRVRSYFLMAFNTALLISLGIVSFLADANNFSKLYALSAVMLVPIFIILVTKLHEYRHEREVLSVASTLRFLRRDSDITRILLSNVVLQFFYVFMVIYLPLLLIERIGFDWSEIGRILIIMILPFLIFQIPVGRVIDKRTGEKEFLFLGFIIMAVACFTIPFIGMKIFWLWALILFISRIGASIVEVSNESYFFKKIDEHHPGLVSLFRMTGPAAYVIAPLVALPLLRLGYGNVFLFLGFACLTGLLCIPKIDTK